MKNHFLCWCCLGLFALLFSSCEKTVDINLSSTEKLVVVEGVIETDQLPYVSLTNSIGFFDKIDLSAVNYVHQAQIQVLDLNTNQQITLREYSVDTTIGSETFSFNIYGPDISDPVAMNFKGQVDHSYKLTISSGGKTYEGVAKIPVTPPLDSVWIEPVPGRETEYAALKALYSDPDSLGNAVRIETLLKKKNKTGDVERFLTSFNSVYDDGIINGTRIPLSIDLGYDKSKQYSQDEFQTLGYLQRGDTVTLKWSAIDRGVFKFWELLAISAGSVGNPFASPTKVQGNVKGALGVWSAFSPIYYTVVDTLK